MSEEDIIKSIDKYFNLDKVEEGEAFKRGYFSAMYRIKNIWKQLEDKNKKQKEVLDKIKEILNKMIYEGYAPSSTGSIILYTATGENSEFGTRAKVILELLEKINE